MGYLVRVMKELTHNANYDLMTRIARALDTPYGVPSCVERIS